MAVPSTQPQPVPVSAFPDTDDPSLPIYQIAFEHAPIGIALVALDGTWLRVNTAICRLLGYSAAELAQKTFQDITHPDDVQMDETLLNACLSGSRSQYCLEKRYVHRDGSVIWVLLNANLVRNEAEEPLYFISHVQAIGDRKDMEERLRQSEARFRRLTDEAPVMLWTTNAEHRFEHFNRAFLEFTGLSSAETLDNNWERTVHPDDLAESLRVARAAFATRAAFQQDFRLRRRDGVFRSVENAGAPCFSADGAFEGYVGVCADVTDMVEATERAEELSERLSLAINAAKIGVFDWDTVADSLQWDRRTFRIHGLDERRDRVSFETWQGVVHPEDRDRFTNEAQAALQGSARLDTLFRVQLPDERIRHVRAIAQIVRDSHGQPVRMVGFTWDVSEQNAAEADIRAAMEAAKRADLAKSTFLATMSHEIRTPLNGIIGFTHLLLDSELSPQIRQLAKPILAGGEALLAIINDILDYSKIEAGRVDLERLEFSAASLLREVIDLLAPKASEKGLTLELRLHSSLPGDVVGDPNRLRQILANLVSNAVKFTQDGCVVIDASGTPAPNGHCLLQIDVSDTGIGIPPEKINDLFEPFNQLDASTTRRFGGTGLGLAISKRLVDAMHGTLEVQSNPGVATTFKFSVPLPLAAAPEFQAAPPPRAKSMTQRIIPINPVSSGARHLRLLIAEDNEINQRLIRQILSRMGFQQVTVVDNGQEALDAVEAERFDAILMDCQMPVMDGYEATRRLRAAGHTIPIVALTAAALSGDKERALAAGMTDYVTKPIRPDLLAEAVERVATK